MSSRLVPIDTYERAEPGRIKEPDLVVGDTYTGMFTLISINNYAVLCNLKLGYVNPQRTLIRFSVLDLDLHSKGEDTCHAVSDGYVNAGSPDERHHRVGSPTGTRVDWGMGILRDYEGKIELPTLEETIDLTAELELVR